MITGNTRSWLSLWAYLSCTWVHTPGPHAGFTSYGTNGLEFIAFLLPSLICFGYLKLQKVRGKEPQLSEQQRAGWLLESAGPQSLIHMWPAIMQSVRESPFLLENSWPAVVYKTLFRRFAGRKHTDFKVSLPQALVWCNVRREAPLSLRPSVWPWHLPHHCVLGTCLVLCLPHYLLKYVLGELKKASFLLTCLSSCFPYEILSVFWEDLYFTMCLQQFHVKHAEWRDAISLIIINNNRLIKILGSC